MKEFENIPSRLFEQTNDWVKKEKITTKSQYPNNPKLNGTKPKSYNRPISASMSNRQKYKILQEPILNFDHMKEQKLSMFDNYYKEKLIEKGLMKSPEEIELEHQKENLDIQYENQLRQLKAYNNVEQQLEADYEGIKKVKLKKETPSSKERGFIQPHQNNKNFIKENKYVIKNIEKPVVPSKSEQNPFHHDFGKLPQYIKNMRIENEIRKQEEIKRKEEEKYPKGTRLLSEEERLATLKKLQESKYDIQQLIEKLPITMHSNQAKIKQKELYTKLDEIENAINTFSRKKVFVKINS